MAQEEKKLLLKDLCARLPYEAKVLLHGSFTDSLCKTLAPNHIFGLQKEVLDVKPYLRPLSSMTEKEKREYITLSDLVTVDGVLVSSSETFDWLISHHFDYRGLIPMGLALEAQEGMYKTK